MNFLNNSNDFIYINNIFNNNSFTLNSLIKENILKYFNYINTYNFNNNTSYDFFIGFLNKNNYNINNGHGLLIKDKILIQGNISNNNFYNSNTSFIYNKSINIYYNGSIINNNFYKGTLKYNNILLSGEFLNSYPHNLCYFNNKHFIYDGSWNFGKKNGYGISKILYNNNLDIQYDGEWNNDKYHGIGILYNNNIKYHGNFFYNLKHGDGKLFINNNSFYVQYNYNKLLSKMTPQEQNIHYLKNINNKLSIQLNNNNQLIKNQENTIHINNNKYNDLMKSYSKLSELLLCKICYKFNSNILIIPCNHVSTCDKCITKITNKKCPICRATFHTYKNIFIS